MREVFSFPFSSFRCCASSPPFTLTHIGGIANFPSFPTIREFRSSYHFPHCFAIVIGGGATAVICAVLQLKTFHSSTIFIENSLKNDISLKQLILLLRLRHRLHHHHFSSNLIAEVCLCDVELLPSLIIWSLSEHFIWQ